MASSRNLFAGVSWTKTLENEGEQVPQLVEAGKKQFAGKEIKGKTLGVIEFGAIGALIANDAIALDMDVIGFDPFPGMVGKITSAISSYDLAAQFSTSNL